MGTLPSLTLVMALLAVLTTAPHLSLAGRPRVRFSDPEPLSGQAEKSDMQMMLDHGMNVSAMTEQDAVAMVCCGLQNDVTACRTVAPFEDYARQNCARLFGMPAPPQSRKKRQSGSFSSFWDNFWHTPSFSGGFNSYSGFGSLVCPSPTDQSFIFRPNPDSSFYPAVAIGSEFLINPLGALLVNEIVLPEDPPQVFVENFRLQSNYTCPFTQLRLYSYQSLQNPGLCWVLQNFGDLIFYRECAAGRFCRGCQQDRFSSFSFGNRNSQKLCVPDYRAVSFWAFCPSLPPGARFVRDRIIVPMSCNCQDVQCERVFQG